MLNALFWGLLAGAVFDGGVGLAVFFVVLIMT